MARRTRRKSLAAQTFELEIVAPQVIAHRIARMAGAPDLNKAAESILAKGMAPIHRRAVANAKRLRRLRP